MSRNMKLKKLIIKFFRELEKLGEAIIKSFENNYYQIFRGGIFLIGVSLAGLSQTMPVLLDHEQYAMELKYEFEEKSDVKLADAECENFKTLYKVCSLGKYKADVVSSTIEILNTLVSILFFIGFSMIPFSVLGYVIKVTSKNSNAGGTADADTNS